MRPLPRRVRRLRRPAPHRRTVGTDIHTLVQNATQAFREYARSASVALPAASTVTCPTARISARWGKRVNRVSAFRALLANMATTGETPTNPVEMAAAAILLSMVSACSSEPPQPAIPTSKQALSGTVLYVAGSVPNRADAALQHRLRSRGLAVQVTSARAARAADATGKSLIVISSTVSAAVLGSEFREVSVPVMTWESEIYDDMGMAPDSRGASGTSAGQYAGRIAAPESPLAADLNERVRLTRKKGTFSWARPSAAARVVTVPNDPSKAVVFAYDKGEPMSGLPAPARRIGFFLEDTTATTLTASGWALFDAAIHWAIDDATSTSDTDGDRLTDMAETNTGVFMGIEDTGTNPNDPDTDGDGISDGDEVLGTSEGLDLPALGVSPLRKNVLLEYDWFDDSIECGRHSHRPTRALLDRVTEMFARAPVANPDGTSGITLIHDFGQGEAFDGGNLIPDADGVLPGAFDDEYLAYREAHFARNRRGYFHYVMLPHYYSGNSLSSGYGEIVGDDFIVSLYCKNSDLNVGNTIAHELGHNLGLHHGGGTDDPTNYKPNYNSVMNYNYQFAGVDADCTPPGDGVLDYSRGANPTLDENDLNERDGICGGVPWDFDLDGTIEENPVTYDVNFDASLSVLSDHDDWSSLVYDWEPTIAARTIGAPRVVACDPVPAPAAPRSARDAGYGLKR